MKFCKKRKHEYKSTSGTSTTCDYILLDDVIDFHGDDFAKKWQEFIKLKPRTFIHGQECYFYADYEFAARQTQCYLNPDN